mgnify:FL=1
MDEIESLCRLCEAVETAGADIAPTYAEYVQLAFAIATDCGEAGRDFSIACAGCLPSISANMPNGYSPTHSTPNVEKCTWAPLSTWPKRRE